MEIFTASTRPTVEECLRYASEANLLVGIIAWRYGWEPDGQKSITEMEYDAATCGRLRRATCAQRFFEGQGRVRLQPRDTRRQLEQRCPELPVGHAQQQQARQPQQQRGLPPLQLKATVRSRVFKDAPPAPTP